MEHLQYARHSNSTYLHQLIQFNSYNNPNEIGTFYKWGD